MTDAAPAITAPAAPVFPPDAVPALLMVDDEPHVLKALQRALYADGYRMLTAHSGAAALEVMQREPIAVILSDQRMAHMAGTEFLEAARQIQPDAVRLMLTGYADPQAIIDAINRGQVYRYISKPWDDGDLRLTLRRAFDQFNLVRENRRLTAELQVKNTELAAWNGVLEQKVAERTAEVEAQRVELDNSFADTVRVFVTLLEFRDAAEATHGRRVAEVARFVAEFLKLSPAEVRDIELAAALHDLGKFSIPDGILAKPESALTTEEREIVQRHPIMGQVILSGISRLKRAGEYIYFHHERFDGLGYPEKLAGSAIPLGARVIAAADGFDHAVYTRDEAVRRPPVKALEELARQAEHRYDPQVVLALAGYVKWLRRQSPERGELKIALSLLKPGMILARDLATMRGRLLAARDTPLTHSHVERIANFARFETLTPIYIIQTNLMALEE